LAPLALLFEKKKYKWNIDEITEVLKVLVRYPRFREGRREVASQGSIEPEFALQLKYAGDISYKKLQNIFHLIKKKFHISYPTETMIQNAKKIISPMEQQL